MRKERRDTLIDGLARIENLLCSLLLLIVLLPIAPKANAAFDVIPINIQVEYFSAVNCRWTPSCCPTNSNFPHGQVTGGVSSDPDVACMRLLDAKNDFYQCTESPLLDGYFVSEGYPACYIGNNGGGYASTIRNMELSCPVGYTASGMECVREYKYYIAAKPMSCPYEGNPCSPATGNKTQTETDFTLANSSLKVQRYYSSQGVGDGFEALGPRWHHNYSQRFDGYGPETHIEFLEKSPLYDIPEAACTEGWEELKGGVYHGLLADTTPVYNGGTCDIRRNDGVVLVLPVRNTLSGQGDTETRTVNRNNGGAITFSYRAVENSTQESWQPLHPTNASLTQLSTTWSFTASDGAVETYDSEGKLLTTKDRNSQTTTFAYDEQGQLNLVTGHFGDTLTYHYDEIGHLICITTPEGDLNYGYDTDGRLNRVTYIDGSERHYHYEDSRFPYHLTGITDEKDERYASWAYDIKGRAVSSEHANGAERVTFNYNGDGTTTVTDAVGAARTYHFIVKQGAMKVIHIEGDRCTTCSNGGIQTYTYDTNGFIASRTDWNGNTTSYVRDNQGRELSRTEASGTPEARTITTTWNMVLNKPLVITEPDQITEYTYDASGRILTQQQRPHP